MGIPLLGAPTIQLRKLFKQAIERLTSLKAVLGELNKGALEIVKSFGLWIENNANPGANQAVAEFRIFKSI